MKKYKTIICLAFLTVTNTAFADTLAANKIKDTSVQNDFINALKGGKPSLDVRYRYESVDQKKLKDASASTVRTKIGYQTADFYNTSALIEFENITKLGGGKYNDSVNGQTKYATVADPQLTQLNQAYINWKAPLKSNLKLGRQTINLDNQRFVGAVDWRQNDQTFDAINFTNNFFKNFNLNYTFSNKVNRVFGPDATGTSASFKHDNVNLINASYSSSPHLKTTAYSYLLDIKELPTLSSKTSGLRFTGEHKLQESLKLGYSLEYARQGNYANNTNKYSASYFLVEPSISYQGFTALAGYEKLGSDNGTSFQTPLATLHAFNGWADKFLSTPANGLQDFYGSIAYKTKNENPYLNGINSTFVFHDFHSDKNRVHYGKEYDFLINKKFAKYYDFGLKFAYFEADEPHQSTTTILSTKKIMVYTGVKF